MTKASSGPETPSSDRRVSHPPGNAKPRAAAKAGGPDGKPKSPSLSALGRDAPPLAQQRAAVILEVLAGEQTAAEAARLLGISVMHYYLLERKAIEGLVAACAPRPKGPPGPSPEQELARLRRELDHSRRECLRQAALVRATQRAIGFPVAKTPSSKEPPKDQPAPRKGKRAGRRRSTVRALRAARRVRQNSSGPETRDVVQQSPLEEIARLDGCLIAPLPTATDRSRRETQEARHGTERQEAGGDGACEAAVGVGVGQTATDPVPGDVGG